MRQILFLEGAPDGIALAAGAGDDADAAERRVFCLDLLQVGNDERGLVLAVVEVLEQRLRTAGQRRNPLVVVRTAVEIIDGAAG